MAKYSEMHYQGFIDTCAVYGIEKEAADRLYKEAAIGTIFKAIGRGIMTGAQKGFRTGATSGKFLGRTRGAVSGAFNQAKTNVRRVRSIGSKGLGRGMSDVERKANLIHNTPGAAPTPTPTAGGTPAAAPTPTPTAGGTPAAAPTPTAGGTPAAPTPTPTAGGTPAAPTPTGGAGEAAKNTAKTTMMQRWGNFAKKHPRLGVMSVAVPSVGLAGLANSHANDPAYGTATTMTPWEQSMYNRVDSGYGLPGLGMDPSYFSGSKSYSMYGL